MANENRVDYKSRAYLDMEELWDLIDDLLAGTKAMRQAAHKWLPKKGKEEDQDWTNRVAQSFLFNGYEKTLDELASKPFEKPVTLEGADSLSEFLSLVEDDVDRSGQNLTEFAREVFHEALHRGVTHVLVDFPRVAEGATLEDRRNMRARPIFIHVQAPRLLGWQTERLEDGSEVLSQIRVFEETIEPDGLYGEKTVERIRVYTRSTWEIHERIADDARSLGDTLATGYGPDPNPGPDEDLAALGGGFEKVSEGTHTFGEIPLLTLYTKRAGLLIGKPVFENVAQINLAHFQSASRQRAYLDFARLGTVVLLGFSEQDMEEGVTWGVNRFIRSGAGPQEASVEVVEHRGEAIAAGERDLEKLEHQMQLLGTAPLVQRAAAMTATGEARDEEAGMSKVESWVRAIESLLYGAYEYAAKWLEEELPENFAVNVYDDFGITQRGQDEARLLFDLHGAGAITKETLLRELKRRGYFEEAFEVEQELDRLEEEGPPLSAVGAAAVAAGAAEAEADDEDDEPAPANDESTLPDDEDPDA